MKKAIVALIIIFSVVLLSFVLVAFRFSNETFDYKDKGIIEFEYPHSEFEYSNEYDVESLVAKDGSITILFQADKTEADYIATMNYYDAYNGDEYKNYSSTGTTIAGYSAREISYYESDHKTYNRKVYIKFGDDSSKYYGISISIYGENSYYLDTKMVNDLIASIKVKK